LDLQALLNLVEQLQARILRLEAENQLLRTQLEEAQRATARQAAPFRRPDTRKIPPEQHKRPGRKPGHPGVFRQAPEHIDERVEVPLDACPRCGRRIDDAQRVTQIIEELPPVRPHVVEVVTYTACCPCCGDIRSTHPLQTSTAEGAAKVQLGPRALSIAATLNKQHGLTMRSTCRVLRQLAGLRFSAGGLSHALNRMAGKVGACYDALLEQVRRSPAVFVDETSWWVGGPGWWLWTFTTPQTTVYKVEKCRGSAVVAETLGPEFAGYLVSDCLATYDPAPYRKHKCIAHHLRAIKAARDLPETVDPSYLDDVKTLFQSVCFLHGMHGSLPEDQFIQSRKNLERKLDQLLSMPSTQPGDQKIINRLNKQRPHLLGCLYEPAAEPTNNRAERSLRPAVIARKLSSGNKTVRGKSTWENLASLAATCRQQGEDFIDYLALRLPLAYHAVR
jgi:hypothetical protein